MTKRCSKCGQEKDVSEFDRLRGQCRICRAAYQRKWWAEHRELGRKKHRQYYESHKAEHRAKARKYYLSHREQAKQSARKHWMRTLYNLAPRQHSFIYVKQLGCCAVCGDPTPYDKMQTEHNHTTGKVRGLTCARCNLLVGMLESYGDLVPMAQKYIEADNE
jgi:ribosomal protein L20